jgi:UDP-glucose 4-epimerase
MRALVTGGAGYIGSHMTLELLDAGNSVVVVDDLSTGLAAAVPQAAQFVRADVADQGLLRRLIVDSGVEAILHFAGSIVVPDSVANPLAYYLNNTVKSRALIETAVETGVRYFLHRRRLRHARQRPGGRNRSAQAAVTLRQLQADDGNDAGGCRAGA